MTAKLSLRRSRRGPKATWSRTFAPESSWNSSEAWRGARPRDRGLAPRQASELFQELSGANVLDQVALGPRLDRLKESLAVITHGQHHNRNGRQLHRQPLGRNHAVLSRELNVHQHDVRLERMSLRQGTLNVLGLANDGEIVLIGEERDEPFAEERMVVNQEESQGVHARSPFSFLGWE